MSERTIKLFIHALLSEENKKFLRGRLPTGATAVFLDELTGPARREEFARADYAYGNPPADWLEGEDIRLQWVQLYSAGFSEYQQLGRSIPVSNLHGFFARPCAETLVGGILAIYRKIDELTLLKSRKEWIGSALRPRMKLLHGKKVILLGTGTIALAIREILMGFRCELSLYGRTHPEARFRTKQELLEALPEADILINTLPGTVKTKGFVSADLLQAMHPDAIVANIGRGSTVDEPALLRALQERRIGGAVLDVYAQEPLPVDSPLWNCPNVILTQHTGGGSAEEERGKISFFLENLSRVLAGDKPLNLVDLRRGY